MSGRSLLLAMLTEAQWQVHVLAWAKQGGWCVYHPYDSRRSAFGWPDLVLAHPDGRALFVELKAEDGKLTVAQREWMALLGGAGLDARVWRPSQEREVRQLLLAPAGRGDG